MWDLILNPFVTLLTWMYSIFNNEVVLAIIAITILVRVITYPLFAKQQQSSKRMQELQPRLKKIQEKYKGREKEPEAREKMVQEQMALYREAGVSPFTGCLPLLIQLPIMIALYQAINFALANTPFQLVDLADRLLIPGLDSLIPLKNVWLGMNLTQPPTPPVNPTYALILPLLVMVTTYFQSKLAMPQTPAVCRWRGEPGGGHQPLDGHGHADHARCVLAVVLGGLVGLLHHGQPAEHPAIQPRRKSGAGAAVRW